MTTGTELTTFITALNAEAAIDPTLLAVLAQNAQTILEAERPWMVLRKTNSTLSVTTSNIWTTATSLATVTDFSRFYGEYPVRLYDGTRTTYLRQVPFDRQLEYKDASGTFRHSANANALYFNGVLPFSGTLYMNYIASSTAIDTTSATAIWTAFPARFLPIIGYYAIGIFKGAVDYDEINRAMLPTNASVLAALKNAMVAWDNELQLSEIVHNDPSEYNPSGSYIDRS